MVPQIKAQAVEVQVSNRHDQDERMMRGFDSLNIYNPLAKQLNDRKMQYSPVVVNITKVPL